MNVKMSFMMPAPTPVRARVAVVAVVAVVGLTPSLVAPARASPDALPGASPRLERACQGAGACNPPAAAVYAEAFARGEPVVEVLTMGVGSLFWERHGHIALCVRNREPERDRCINYGLGNFDDPVRMAWGFFRGERSFWAGPQEYSRVLAFYARHDRTVWAQPLPLTAEQRDRVLAAVAHDIREENKAYRYDHFWDNCTTRVRDVLDRATDGALSRLPEAPDARTYRDLARAGFHGFSIARLALVVTDLGMGRATDRVPSRWERMFLPDFMREAVRDVWGMEPLVLYQRRGPPAAPDGPSGRLPLALLALAGAAWVAVARRRGRHERLALAVVFLPQVVLGAVLLLLALISPISYVKWNETCLVLLPLDALLLVMRGARLRRYAQARVVMLAALAALMLAGVLLQPLMTLMLWPLLPTLVIAALPAHATPAPAARVAG